MVGFRVVRPHMMKMMGFAVVDGDPLPSRGFQVLEIALYVYG